MAFRKMTQKKYNGLLEYYNQNSTDKETRAYYLNYRDEDGKTTKKKSQFLDRDDALQELNDIKSRVTRAKKLKEGQEKQVTDAVKNKRLTLDQLAKLYHDKKYPDDKRITRTYATRISAYIGSKMAAKLTLDDLKELQDQLTKAGYKPRTINWTITSIKTMYNFAKSNKWLDSNPLADTRVKKVKEDSEPGRVLNDEELDILFNALKEGDFDRGIKADKTLYLGLKLLLLTGARPTGILELKVNNIDFENKKVHIKAMKQGAAYKRKINDEVVTLLQNWIQRYDLKYGDYIFFPKQTFHRSKDEALKKTPMSYVAFSKRAKKVLDKLFNEHIPKENTRDRVVVYSFRRTAGTKIYKKLGIMQAMMFLNHSNVNTTQIYLNLKSDMEEFDMEEVFG